VFVAARQAGRGVVTGTVRIAAKVYPGIGRRAGVFRSCRRRSHGGGSDENLYLCCSPEVLGRVEYSHSEMRRRDRQRIALLVRRPRNGQPATDTRI
jgi:hypothetical protein